MHTLNIMGKVEVVSALIDRLKKSPTEKLITDVFPAGDGQLDLNIGFEDHEPERVDEAQEVAEELGLKCELV